MDTIAVLNAGSSSIKCSLFGKRGDALELTVHGQAEGLYTAPRFIAKHTAGTVLDEKSWGDGVPLGHEGALDHLFAFIRGVIGGDRLVGVGHRVVHGGSDYSLPVRVDLAVLATLEKFSDSARSQREARP
jgi:acetate kinase